LAKSANWVAPSSASVSADNTETDCGASNNRSWRFWAVTTTSWSRGGTSRVRKGSARSCQAPGVGAHAGSGFEPCERALVGSVCFSSPLTSRSDLDDGTSERGFRRIRRRCLPGDGDRSVFQELALSAVPASSRANAPERQSRLQCGRPEPVHEWRVEENVGMSEPSTARSDSAIG